MAISCGNCKAYCCRIAGRIMKELDRGDGICLYLNSDNKCEIYDSRPFICNTDRVYEKYFRNRYTAEQWKEMNLKSCEELRERYGEEETEIQGVTEVEEIQKRTEEEPESRPYNGIETDTSCGLPSPRSEP